MEQKGVMLKSSVLAGLLMLGSVMVYATQPENRWRIKPKSDAVRIQAGILEYTLDYPGDTFSSEFKVSGHMLENGASEEIRVVFHKAFPNKEPEGIGYSAEGGVEQTDAVKNQTDALAVNKKESSSLQQVEWGDSLLLCKDTFAELFNRHATEISEPERGIRHLTVTFFSDKILQGLVLEFHYEIYEDYPAIRKWVKFRNQGDQWLKISDLALEKVSLSAKWNHSILLTPNSRGIDPSIVAFGDSAASCGIILASEIPSKLRQLSTDGTNGYHPAWFEWVIGPGETFESEPVFMYAFDGKSYPTVSAVSTALDRCVESGFQSFLNQRILLQADKNKQIAPVFCSWTNYSANINDTNMRVAADIASRMGFRCFQLDAGWSDTGPGGGWAVSTPRPNLNNFRDLKGLSEYIRSQNMKTGLWYSDFINEQLTEKQTGEPPLFSLPLIRRAGGLGLSYCYDKSRKKYVGEIVGLHNAYHADYFKQDLSNVCYGDLARGHESRTLKESYLRGLRGLLATQDEIHRQTPEVWLQLSHEIYWETPGPEADLAVLKHADSYHSAPNEYWGAGNRSRPVSPEWNYNVDSLKQKLIQGAFRARNLWYSHRGLPLDRIEVFGAVTTCFKGSLTDEIIDRQICSWLMGAPISFSGDLSSLSEDNIEHYRSRFSMIEALQHKYGIFSCFQFSGVPGVTDEGWHWWGKLNSKGCGAVIVLRGRAGADQQKINIPWVTAAKKYRIKLLFAGKDLGVYTGEQLIKGDFVWSLKPMGQEIIEISMTSGHEKNP